MVLAYIVPILTMPEKLEVKLGESDKIEGLLFKKSRQDISITALHAYQTKSKQ